jgi:Flp pilus assembly protein TadG
MAVIITALLLFSGLAMDGGRAYLVKAQLAKAVDGAALAAARSLNSGDPQAEANLIFNANFSAGYMGTTSVDHTFSSVVDESTGMNVVTITGTAVMPTTFMQLAHLSTVSVNASAQATRRMVDLSIVLDVSSSIGSKWSAVRDATRAFIDAFDQNNDRLALATYSNGASVLYPMPSSRGFDKQAMINAVPQSLPGGSTAMVEGLYRAWDELRSVPAGQQSGLRVIVLFTDGASNSLPGAYDASPATAKGLRSYDFPKNLPDPDGQTWDAPVIQGLYDTATGAASPSYSLTTSTGSPAPWNSTQTISQVPWLPLTTWHSHHRSSGIPTSFPLQTASLTVNGAAQSSRRGLRGPTQSGTGRYPAQVFNINNAARNVLEIIANAARSDNGDYRIRIYTIGMGELVRYNLGTMPEKPEDILKRIANARSSLDFNSAQLEGKYYYAKTVDDVGPVFEQLQNDIIRLTK